jgi:hypothetical protein
MKYVVLVVGMSLKNNKIAEGNDIVEDEQLATPAETLINTGFIKKASKTDIQAYQKKLEKKSNGKVIEATEANVIPKEYNKLKKEELIAELNLREIEFKEADTNADLIKLLEEDDKDLS